MRSGLVIVRYNATIGLLLAFAVVPYRMVPALPPEVHVSQPEVALETLSLANARVMEGTQAPVEFSQVVTLSDVSVGDRIQALNFTVWYPRNQFAELTFQLSTGLTESFAARSYFEANSTTEGYSEFRVAIWSKSPIPSFFSSAELGKIKGRLSDCYTVAPDSVAVPTFAPGVGSIPLAVGIGGGAQRVLLSASENVAPTSTATPIPGTTPVYRDVSNPIPEQIVTGWEVNPVLSVPMLSSSPSTTDGLYSASPEFHPGYPVEQNWITGPEGNEPLSFRMSATSPTPTATPMSTPIPTPICAPIENEFQFAFYQSNLVQIMDPCPAATEVPGHRVVESSWDLEFGESGVDRMTARVRLDDAEGGTNVTSNELVIEPNIAGGPIGHVRVFAYYPFTLNGDYKSFRVNNEVWEDRMVGSGNYKAADSTAVFTDPIVREVDVTMTEASPLTVSASTFTMSNRGPSSDGVTCPAQPIPDPDASPTPSQFTGMTFQDNPSASECVPCWSMIGTEQINGVPIGFYRVTWKCLIDNPNAEMSTNNVDQVGRLSLRFRVSRAHDFLYSSILVVRPILPSGQQVFPASAFPEEREFVSYMRVPPIEFIEAYQMGMSACQQNESTFGTDEDLTFWIDFIVDGPQSIYTDLEIVPIEIVLEKIGEVHLACD